MMDSRSYGDLQPLTRVYVNLDALSANVRALKATCADRVNLMAVVKANGYGHGAVETAKTALASGASWLAVARISEAVTLRRAGVTAPILLFGDILPEQAVYAADHDIRISLASIDAAKEISAAARGAGCRVKAHVKMDTGMGRLGLLADPELNIDGLIQDFFKIRALPGLQLEGIYTHFANADAHDKAHVLEQAALFSGIRDTLKARGETSLLAHGANSAAVIELPGTHFDMVRPGISLYGLWPSNEVGRNLIRLEPAMSIRSRIIHIKDVPKGFKVSYGSTHITPHPTQIATVPIGYADGYSRLLSGCGTMLVRGMRARITGRVCMDFTMIDVGHIPGVCRGDEVVILGTQGNESVSADDIAKLTGTINYEVTAGLTGRMPLVHERPAGHNR